MNQEYDIYEKIENNYQWKALAVGHKQAMLKLLELSGASSNEFVVMYTSTNEVFARIDAARQVSASPDRSPDKK